MVRVPNKGKSRAARWYCKCDCGGEHEVVAHSLKSGVTTHCGCSDGNKTHGGYKTKLYKRWVAMRQRCRNPNCSEYRNYGARGIAICREWDEDFVAFRDWALSNGYRDDLEIDRVDNDKGYSPENCRFIDRVGNANNLRKNRRYRFRGKDYTIAELARLTGAPYGSLRNRLVEMGMDVETALSMPFDRRATRRAIHGY